MKTSRMWMGLSLAAMMSAGCAQEQESLIVLHVPFEDAGECTIDGSNDTIRSEGLLDVQFGTSYSMPVILLNQLQGQTAMMTNNQIDNGELQLIDADVTLSIPQTPELIDAVVDANDDSFVDFTVDLSSVSLASGGRTPVSVEVISQPTSVALADEMRRTNPTGSPRLLATTVFHARRTGNRVGKVGEIESRAFVFPITLCLGCLYTCSGCAGMEPDFINACFESAPDPTIAGGSTGYYNCGRAQDFPIGPSYCENPNTTN